MRTPKEIALMAARSLDNKMGQDIQLLEVTDLTVLANHFLICTATSSTHVKTLCDEVEHDLTEAGETLLRREGERSGGWVLLDFGCLIVHVFTEESRKFYDLERLWADAVNVELNWN